MRLKLIGMSRIGKKVVIVPDSVELKWDKINRTISAKGPLGQSQVTLKNFIKLNIEDNTINLSIEDENDKFQKSMWGTTRALISNIVQGVSKGFNKQLELNGVGYKMELGTELVLYVGFSHPVKVVIPDGIQLKLDKNLLTGTSSDKQALGDFFGKVFAIKPCDVYKHKGFKVPGKFYRKKEGKKAK